MAPLQVCTIVQGPPDARVSCRPHVLERGRGRALGPGGRASVLLPSVLSLREDRCGPRSSPVVEGPVTWAAYRGPKGRGSPFCPESGRWHLAEHPDGLSSKWRVSVPHSQHPQWAKRGLRAILVGEFLAGSVREVLRCSRRVFPGRARLTAAGLVFLNGAVLPPQFPSRFHGAARQKRPPDDPPSVSPRSGSQRRPAWSCPSGPEWFVLERLSVVPEQSSASAVPSEAVETKRLPPV